MAKLIEQPAPYPLAVKIGECLHNMRSSLDLLAYELAAASTKLLPDDVAESSEFPIFGDEDKSGQPGIGRSAFFRTTKAGTPAPGSGIYKIRGIDPRTQTDIERLQPYNRGSHFREDPLWILHKLDRINKHRLLHVVAASGALVLRIGDGYDPARDYPFAVGDIHSFTGVVVGDQPTRLGSFPLRPDIRKDDMRVHPEAIVEMVIDDVPSLATMPDIVKGPPVVGVLTQIFDHLTGTIVPTLTPYLPGAHRKRAS